MRLLYLVLGLAALLLAGGAKKPVIDVRVHALGNASEAPTFAFPATLLNGTPVFLQRMPLVTQREVRAVYPFQAADGTLGTYLQLDSHGTRLLQQHSMSRQGDVLVVLVNGRQISNLLVDRPINDGIISIPRGLVADDIEFLTSVFPVVGEEGGRRRR
jgi:hypothetical protein